IIFDDSPAIIKEAGIEALLIDQVSVGTNVAEFLGLPYITVCNAMLQNREIGVPPFNTLWQYNPAWWALLRNRMGYSIMSILGKPYKKTIAEYRQKLNLPVRSNANSYFPLAVVSQQPAEFEFPRKKLPEWFHFTGPFWLDNPNRYSGTREPVPFPWEKLTGQPLIYAAMGTLQNRLVDVFEKIATACEGLDAQLVISLGGGLTPDSLPQLPGNPLVVSYAPQLELLQKATLTITHAGLNAILGALSKAVPMVAIPVTHEQPGLAARIVWTGVGEAIPLKRLSVSRLRKTITKVLIEDSYKQNAMRLQEAIKRAGGGTRAADIIERAVATGKPVLSSQLQK
ncbi:MAG: glycosyl transferase family 1, partial [Okeania sp. SIO2H7]|nr:glycosyl transferase family 1 [Okeania sp. SIO2H7]